MNKFIKIICISVLATASAIAMQPDAKLGKWLIEATQENEHEEALELINQGAPGDYADAYGGMALMYAAGHGHFDCVEALIKAKANINQRTNAGNTALMQAVTSGNVHCVNALVNAKALIDQADNTGTTPLMIAASTGNLPCLEILLAAKAQVNQKDRYGKKALNRTKNPACFEALARAEYLGKQLIEAVEKADITWLGAPHMDGSLSEVQQLIAAGAMVNYQDDKPDADYSFHEYSGLLNYDAGIDADTALNRAVLDKHHECVKVLIDAGADVNIVDKKTGYTALMYACLFSSPDDEPDVHNCVKHLIAAKANINYADYHGNTALIVAVICGQKSSVQELIRAKARVGHATNYGETALTWAEGTCGESNSPELWELLVEAMLWIPNQEQKASMIAFLACIKRDKAMWETHRNRISHFKAPFFACVYEQNKKNFPESFAGKQVAKLGNDFILRTSLAKYSNDTNASSSPETKRAKTE